MLVLLNQRHRVQTGGTVSYVDASELPTPPSLSRDNEARPSVNGLSGWRAGSGVKVTRTIDFGESATHVADSYAMDSVKVRSISLTAPVLF